MDGLYQIGEMTVRVGLCQSTGRLVYRMTHSLDEVNKNQAEKEIEQLRTYLTQMQGFKPYIDRFEDNDQEETIITAEPLRKGSFIDKVGWVTITIEIDQVTGQIIHRLDYFAEPAFGQSANHGVRLLLAHLGQMPGFSRHLTGEEGQMTLIEDQAKYAPQGFSKGSEKN